MTPSRLLLIGCALAAFAGCQRREEPAPQPPAAPAAAPAPALSTEPLRFSEQTPYASVRLTLPEAIRTQPELHTALYASTVRELRQFMEGAQADRTEAGSDSSLPPYEKTITVEPGADAGTLFSLKRTDYDYSGGAHGNTLFAGVLWDKAAKRQIAAADLFRPGVDAAALDRALCDAVNAAKQARSPGTERLTLGRGDTWNCPRALQTPMALEPAAGQPGKAGGLVFLIGPYAVGPYAEGAYQIVLPLSAFQGLLNPPYAGDFSGAPVRTGDVTPRQG